jgi:hypothetical protein
MQEELLQWKSAPYVSKHKSVDWFWILGFIVVLSSGLAWYLGNFAFAAVILIGGIVVGLYANDHIEEQAYIVTTKGIKLGEDFFPYEDIKSFWVFTDGLPSKNQLLLTLKRSFFVHTSIALGDTDPDKVRLVLRKYVLEKRQLPALSDAVMDWLKF